MIKLKHITKFYGKLCALSDLSLSIDDGALYGFVGPNGAGKTTAMKIMCGLLQPDSGSLEIDGREIDFARIESATDTLSERYDAVLLEGAGGLMVPLTRSLLTIDYIRDKGYPLIFVTSGKLGSISHTLLSLEAVKNRDIPLKMLVFNMFPHEEDSTIADDTQTFLKDWIRREFPDTEYFTVPVL